MKSQRKILVINLTRMGDILQSTPLLQALKMADPNVQISFLAVTGFADIIRHIPEIDQTIPFNFNSAVAVSKEAINFLPRRLKEIEALINELKAKQFDLVINLSHSKISAVFCHLLGHPNTVGLTLDGDGYRLIRHPWARYFFTANLNRNYNRFNLVDVNLGLSVPVDEHDRITVQPFYPFGRVRLSFQPTPKGRISAHKILNKWENSSKPIRVGFQPGASLPCKCWPTDSFTRLGRQLQDEHDAGIVIFGVKSEAKLAEKINQGLKGEALDLTDKTNLETLAGVLENLDLLISNDTGTQHLAAAVGTPVLSLCFGSAVSHETAPYGPNHVVIDTTLSCHPCSFQVKCKRYVCQEVVRPDAVFMVASKMLRQKRFGEPMILTDDSRFEKVNVWTTGFGEDGFWRLKPIIGRELKAHDYINICVHTVWKSALTNSDIIPVLQHQEALLQIRENLISYLPPDALIFKKELSTSEKALVQLEEAAAQGLQIVEKLEALNSRNELFTDIITPLISELEKIDQRITQTGFKLPAVAHLVLDYSFNKQNLQGDELCRLTESTRQNYIRLYTLSSNLRSLLGAWEEFYQPLKSTTQPLNDLVNKRLAREMTPITENIREAV
jgi:ADP-heptose:LPS heptosyltransferase